METEVSCWERQTVENLPATRLGDPCSEQWSLVTYVVVSKQWSLVTYMLASELRSLDICILVNEQQSLDTWELVSFVFDLP